MSVPVTVLLPCYNGARFLRPAIDSVLAQSFEAFEFLIIDDGSKDSTWEIISSYADPRIRAVRQENRGLAATLNHGIAIATGEFIARQDQDDCMARERLSRQITYLQSEPRCGAVGTWARIVEDDRYTNRTHRHPCSYLAIRLAMLFDNPFVHSSMMMRRSVVQSTGGYCEDRTRQPPEDFELWSRLARLPDTVLANLPAYLTDYREVAGSMSRDSSSPFTRNIVRIAAENIADVLPGAGADDCLALAALFHGSDADCHITMRGALGMLRDAAVALGGAKSTWSEEFANEYRRMWKHVAIRCLRRRVPTFLDEALRSMRGAR